MTPHFNRCVEIVVAEMRVTKEEVCSKQREQRITRARQTAMWLAEQYAWMSTLEIARALDLHHTTIMHGLAAVEERRRSDKAFQTFSDGLLEQLKARKVAA